VELTRDGAALLRATEADREGELCASTPPRPRKARKRMWDGRRCMVGCE